MCWFGIHHVCIKGGSIPQLGFSSLRKKEGKGCWTGEEKFFFFSFWNEPGQGGDQERREASLEVRRYRWNRAEVGRFDLC